MVLLYGRAGRLTATNGGFRPAQEAGLSYSWQANTFPSQSSTFCTFGCLILWFGWPWTLQPL
jgi:hypothetical protein